MRKYLLTLVLLAGCTTAVDTTTPSTPPTASVLTSSASSANAARSSASLATGSFGYNSAGNFETSTTVRGYVQTENDYVYFNLIDAPNADFKAFIQTKSADPYGNKAAIGLGCVTNGVIQYQNDSDKFGMKQIELGSKASNLILNSTQQNPIALRLTKLPLTGGREAPKCYSHFTNIEVL